MSRIDNGWYKLDDLVTNKITENDVESDNGAACLLFYINKGGEG